VFVGRFEHSLDDKGRVVLPPTFRSRLAEGGYLTQYQHCLALWSPREFEDFVVRFREKLRNQEAAPNAMRALLANAAEIKVDAQGRIAIPQRLREYAQLASNVVLVGSLDHVELWAPEVWEPVNSEGENGLAEAVNTLGIY
jgi:MraZ protein